VGYGLGLELGFGLSLQYPTHHSVAFMTPTGSERQRTCRYVLGSEQKKTGSLTPYDKATPDKKKQLEREAIIANVNTENKRKVCEDRGIPLDIFTKLWEEYRETCMFDGRFFHRMEVNPAAESENVTNMKSAIAESYRNGNRVRARRQDTRHIL
jgi:hypothetical protein